MRPARKGPENSTLGARRAAAPDPSMRPARKGPENAPRRLVTSAPRPFNEAGPQGAGKLPASGVLLIGTRHLQ